MKRHLAAAAVHGEQVQLFARKNFAKVFGQRADVRGLGGVSGIVVQQRAVSFTTAPQPLAVITMASAPVSTCGHQASMLRRMKSNASSCAERCWLSAPQQPAPVARIRLTPSLSSPRAAPAIEAGAEAGCPTPSSS